MLEAKCLPLCMNSSLYPYRFLPYADYQDLVKKCSYFSSTNVIRITEVDISYHRFFASGLWYVERMLLMSLMGLVPRMLVYTESL